MTTSEIIIAIVSMIAIISSIGFLTLWFFIVKKEMKFYKNKVMSADFCLKGHQERFMKSRDGPKEEDMKNVLKMGIDLYAQVAKDYNVIRKKPQNIVPAILMGFREIESTKSIVIIIDDYKNLKTAR